MLSRSTISLQHCEEEFSGKVALLEFLDGHHLVSIREMLHLLPAEEMDDEAAHLPHILSPMDAGAIVGVACMPHGVDVQSPGLQHPADLLRQEFQLGGGEGHAVEHVGEAAVKGTVFEGERLTDIVPERLDRSGKAALLRLSGDGIDSLFAVIKGADLKPLLREKERVAPSAAAQFEDAGSAFFLEERSRLPGGMARRRAEHVGHFRKR